MGLGIQTFVAHFANSKDTDSYVMHPQLTDKIQQMATSDPRKHLTPKNGVADLLRILITPWRDYRRRPTPCI